MASTIPLVVVVTHDRLRLPDLFGQNEKPRGQLAPRGRRALALAERETLALCVRETHTETVPFVRRFRASAKKKGSAVRGHRRADERRGLGRGGVMTLALHRGHGIEDTVRRRNSQGAKGFHLITREDWLEYRRPRLPCQREMKLFGVGEVFVEFLRLACLGPCRSTACAQAHVVGQQSIEDQVAIIFG